MLRDWIVERDRDDAAVLHARSAAFVAGPARPSAGHAGGPPSGSVGGEAAPVARRLRWLDPTGPAVVLGRAEPDDHVDRERAAAAGVGVARRSSGGGAVMVGPGRAVWIDLIIPIGDPLWCADVGRAMWWVGELWVAALAAIGLPGASVWRGPMQRTEWSERVCFAGLGAGEVTRPGPGGRPVNVVGISQRRTRSGAVFQCSAPVSWDPAELLDVLALSDGRRRAGRAALAGVAAGVGDGAGPLVEAVIARARLLGPARRGGQLS